MVQSAIAHYVSEQEAEDAVKRLAANGFDVRRVTIVEDNLRTERTVTGRYSIWQTVFVWFAWGFFFGFLFAMFWGPGFYVLPGVAAPGLWFIGALVNGLFVGIAAGIVAAIFAATGPKRTFNYNDRVYPTTCTLLLEGTEADVQRARELLAAPEPHETRRAA